MLNKLTHFLQTLGENQEPKTASPHQLEVACAVLLCEVMRADNVLDKSEQVKLSELLSQQFTLMQSEISEIIEEAIALCEKATDLYQFTSIINQNYQMPERIKIVERLWQLAYSDGHLDTIEEHVVRKISDLLYLRHNEFIQAKLNVQQQ